MSLRSIYFGLDRKARVFARYLIARRSAKHYLSLLKVHGIELRRLSAAQKAEVDNVWKTRGGYDTHQLVLSVTGRFDPRICSELLFRTKIEWAINNQDFNDAWRDKGYFDLFFPEAKFPHTIVRNIAGEFYDHDYNVISYEKAKELLKQIPRFIIKPSLDNGLGRGVRLVTETEDCYALLNEYKTNYVIQEVIEQHESFAQLNPSSVNVLRVNSLFVNGRCTPITAALRCGAPGVINDNYITRDGMGMFVIGVDEEGRLKGEAFHSCGKRITKAPNRVDFAGISVPNYEKVKELVTSIHSKLAHFGFIGFDIAIDKNGEPVVMEYNPKGPGVLYYQYVNGPLFGERTEEVAELIRD